MLFDAHCRRAGCYRPVPSPRMSLLPPVAFVAFVALIAFVGAVVLAFADALLLVITTGGEGAGAVGLGVRGGDGDGGLQALLLLLLLSLSLLLGAKPFDDTVASTTTQQTRTMINV